MPPLYGEPPPGENFPPARIRHPIVAILAAVSDGVSEVVVQVRVVDGTWELFRAFYGAPGATAPNGLEVGATRSFLRSMHKLATTPGVTHVAVAFDHVIESFRNDLFAGYKTGEGIDPELHAQFPLVEEAARALGLVVWPMVEFECDDALATAAFRFSEDPRVTRFVICSPDKDLLQCVRGDRVIAWDRLRDVEYDQAGATAKLGVPPESVPDFLALTGDTADGIPGLRGWGAKSAATVLTRYRKLEEIPDDPTQWDVKVRGAAKLAATLSDGRADALLYRTLATLRTDVPLGEVVDDLEWKGPDRPALTALCQRLGDRRFLEMIG